MRTVLLLQDNQVSAFRYQRRQCLRSVSFPCTETAFTDFSTFLRSHHNDEFIVLLDYENEQLQRQHIPRVGRRDQVSLMARQRRSHYGAARFASSYLMSASGGSRSRVIHYGLPEDASESPWLLAIDQSGVRVRSVHWLSLLIGALACGSDSGNSHRIVLCSLNQWDRRVLILRGRQPLMVRRIARGNDLAEQVLQTVAYVDNVSESKAVSTDAEDISLDSMVVIGQFTRVEVETVEQKLGLSSVGTVYLDSASGNLSSKQEADATVQPHSVVEAVVRSVLQRYGFTHSILFRGAVHLQRQLRHALFATGVSLLMGGAVALAASRHINQEMSVLGSFASSIDSMAIDIKKAHAHPEWASDYSIDAIRESVAYLDAMDATNQSTPFHFIVSLSEQLTLHPEIVLQSIEWNSAGDDRAGTAESDGDYRSGSFNAVVTGSITVPQNGQSESMNRFRSFVASIRDASALSAQGIDLTVIDLPFATGSPVSDDHSNGEFTLEIYSPGELQ